MTRTPATQPILIVDDDPEITSGLARGLALHGYATVTENRLDRALARVRQDPPRAAIIDVMLGADSGLALVRSIRGHGHQFPVLMLSALSDVEDRARGLEAGADDYIVKPFSFDELVARLKVQERRARPDPTARLVLNPRNRTVRGPVASAMLTEREFALLEILVQNAGRVLSRGEIFDSLWAGDGTSSENIVDVYIGYLRKKLAPPEAFGAEIRTIRNKGFAYTELDP